VSAPVRQRALDNGSWPLEVLRCPSTGSELSASNSELVSVGAQQYRYEINPRGIPLFAKEFRTEEARAQEAHYERIAAAYVAHLDYPHTREYMAYLDRALLDVVEPRALEWVAEICCGRGEAFALLGNRVRYGIGVDISEAMLETALVSRGGENIVFVQGDATRLPLAGSTFDSVFMLGGVHHVNDRGRLFQEIARVLKPGGKFYFREPVNDFALWRWLRAAIYRWAPALDHETEHPLRSKSTVADLKNAGLICKSWKTHGFLGFCLLMNSDVLVFNRVLRFVPGIRPLARWAARVDAWTIKLPGLAGAGLQVVGVAQKPS
jgi:ubiquinone/menaquinone biosynthesis C-methylase UbiE